MKIGSIISKINKQTSEKQLKTNVNLILKKRVPILQKEHLGPFKDCKTYGDCLAATTNMGLNKSGETSKELKNFVQENTKNLREIFSKKPKSQDSTKFVDLVSNQIIENKSSQVTFLKKNQKDEPIEKDSIEKGLKKMLGIKQNTAVSGIKIEKPKTTF